MRCYSVLSPRSDSKIALEAPDLDCEAEWDISALPWNLLPLHPKEGRHAADKELDVVLLQAIESHASAFEGDKRGIAAQCALLYVYMVMAGSQRNA